MKTKLQMFFLSLLLLISWQTKAQQCDNSCFSTEVVSTEKLSESCTKYQWKVSYSRACAHALSHFTASIPCGELKNLSNSQNWKQEYGLDPTTGLSGFKIDDIPGFGDTSLKSFIVTFTLCTDNSTCNEKLKCWQPVIAYKAAKCVTYDTLHISCNSLTATIEKTDASCFGSADGSLAVFADGGEKPYTYLWSNGGTEETISGVVAGNYSVIVKDAAGEEIALQATIEQGNKIETSGVVQHASCSGSADGGIDVTVSGAGSYSFLWNTGATTEDINNLQAGTYSVVVTDAAGCSVKSTYAISNTSSIQITATQSLPDCNQQNGSLNITVSGGTAPYTYSWSNNAVTEDIQNLGGGLYTVNVTDSKGCSSSISYNLKENNTLKLSASITQTSCVDDASGAINLSVSGGTAPYTYVWSNGASTEDLSGLVTGNYTVTVKDSKGCTTSLRVFVSKKSFQVPTQVIQPNCAGDSTGSITLYNPIGGEGPFTYVWSNGGTGTQVTGLPPGTYSVIVTDNTGCSRELYFVITNPTPISATPLVSNDHCHQEGYFDIDLVVSGGKAPYTFQWSNGETTEDIDSLQSATYTVIVTDGNGCSITESITVTPGEQSLTCSIVQPDSIPVCSSINNVLHTAVLDADSYSWSVQSADGGWAITGGALTSSIQYTAGGANSTATFTLIVVKDGCTQSCTYTVTTCTDNNNGGEDPGGEDPGGEDPGGEDPGGEDPGGEEPGNGSGNETCDECFSSAITIISESESCKTYEITVSTNGNCKHDLSHWVIEVPCGTVSDYSNSEGWKMEFGKDPTSGVYGLKVDDIQGFGGHTDSFTVRFTICGNSACENVLQGWDPMVAYKASTCVAYDTLENQPAATLKVTAFPNPFTEQLHFEWTTTEDTSTKLELLDQFGGSAKVIFDGHTGRNEQQHLDVSTTGMREGIYYYRFTASGSIQYGKLIKN